MLTVKKVEGVLVMDVSNCEDGFIRAGSLVVVSLMTDNFKKFVIEVRSMSNVVRLDSFDVSIETLVYDPDYPPVRVYNDDEGDL